jgi:aldose 1-epimerase
MEGALALIRGFGLSDSIEEDKDEVIVSMSYLSSHLEEKYPGNLSCTTQYKFNSKNEFSICYSATTDRDTIVNITNHNYWNFHGHNDYYGKILDHSAQIYGNQVCEVESDLIPNGNLLNVANTKYDFIESNPISKELIDQGGIDINYVVNNEKEMKPVARVWSNLTGMGVQYSSDQPGLQFYTGGNMHPEYQGKNHRTYGKNYGLCMETQFFPDAINQDNFESPILKVGETYTSNTIIKLSNNY